LVENPSSDRPEGFMSDASAFQFERFGRALHLVLDSADALEQVLALDHAYWVALSAPIESLHMDPRFLEFVDSDKDGRIRSEELRRAVAWVLPLLANRAGLSAGSDSIRPEDVDVRAPAGPDLAEAIRRLQGLRETESDAPLTLAEVRLSSASSKLSLDPLGPEEVLDPGVADVLSAAISAGEGFEGDGGGWGVDPYGLERFVASAQARIAWIDDLANADVGDPRVPFGPVTRDLFVAIDAIEDKVNEYFVLCRAASVDDEFRVRGLPSETEAPAVVDLDALSDAVRQAPLAPPTASRTLSQGPSINPSYESEISALFAGPIAAAYGEDAELEEAQWWDLNRRFASHRVWAEADPAPHLAALSDARLRECLEDDRLKRTRAGVADRARDALDAGRLRDVDKLLSYQKNLLRLTNNFVSFPDLYRPGRRALFDRGDLLLDGRRFNLAIAVHDRSRHKVLAETSNICIVYLRISGAQTEPYEVAVAVTSGGMGNVAIGKRGVFTEPTGALLDAEVVDIVTNPISLGEAMTAPLRRLGEVFSKKIESLSESAQSNLDETGLAAVDQARGAKTPGAPEAPKPSAKEAAPSSSLLAGGSFAIAALGSSLAFVTKTLSTMSFGDVATGLLIALFGVLGPATLLAAIKLRSRDLSPMLEGSGWAVNRAMRLTWRQSRYFTQTPRYPKGSRRRGAIAGWVVGLVLATAALVGAGWALLEAGF
jgi:hypothetical protein